MVCDEHDYRQLSELKNELGKLPDWIIQDEKN